MKVFKVPAPQPQGNEVNDTFRFTIGKRAFTMPSADALIPPAELIDLMALDPAPQNARLMQVFTKHLPKDAAAEFKSKDQIIATLQAWYADGNGASQGESLASAD